jgi:MFS family permease
MTTLHATQGHGATVLPAADTLRGLAAATGATVAMATGFGSLVLPSVMAGPLAAEFGWSLAEVSLGYGFAAFGMAAGGIVWGRLTDRADLRLLLAIGSVFTVLPLWALAHVTALWQFHAAHAVLGLLGFGCLYPAVVCGAGGWFPRRRGLVMGVVTAGGAIGQGVMPYAADALVATLDWRGAYLGLATAVALAQVVVVAGVRHRAVPLRLGHSTGRLRFLRRPRLLTLSGAAFCCCACMGVPLIHLVGHVSAICGSPGAGASAMLAAMTAGAVGRIAFGIAADRIGSLRAYLVASAQQTVCIALLPAMQTEASLLALSVVFGFGFAGNMTCLLLSIRDEVPEALHGAALGVVMFVGWLGMGFGGYAGGVFADVTGSYASGFYLAVIFGGINMALLGRLCRTRPTTSSRGEVRGCQDARKRTADQAMAEDPRERPLRR